MSIFSQINDNEEMSDSGESNQLLLEYKEKNVKLQEENEKLKRALRVITQPTSVKIRDPSKDGPIAQVLLFNNILAQEYAEEIKDFFKKISGRSSRADYVYAPQVSALHFISPENKPNVKLKRSTKQDRKSAKAYVVTNCFQVFSDRFYLDLVGQSLPDNCDRIFDAPSYDKVSLDTLDGEVEVHDNNVKKRNVRSCFNCGFTDHQLKDCPAPKNFQHINQRRKDFVGMMSPQNASTRYHLEKDSNTDDSEFADLKPGNISNALYEAMGITKHELPPYIYQMRWYGYPPGHLLEARMQSSGLSMYSGDKSKKIQSDSDDAEVDVEKIIKYPGFNVKLPRNMIDNHQKLGAPPMDERHSYDVMVSYHKHKNELKRKKQSSESHSSKRQRKVDKNDETPITVSSGDDTREVDMDMGGDSDQEIVIADGETIEIADDKEEGEIDEDEGMEVGQSDLTEEELNRRKAKILELLQLENNPEIEDDNPIITETDVVKNNDNNKIADTNNTSESSSSQVSVIKTNLQNDIENDNLVQSMSPKEITPITIDLTSDNNNKSEDDIKIQCNLDQQTETEIKQDDDKQFVDQNKETVHLHSDISNRDFDNTETNSSPVIISNYNNESVTTGIDETHKINVSSPPIEIDNNNDNSDTKEFISLNNKDNEDMVIVSDEGETDSKLSPNNDNVKQIENEPTCELLLEHKQFSHLRDAAESSGDESAQTDLPAQLLTHESDTDSILNTDNQAKPSDNSTVPHRSNFAKGITEFNSFYEESNSRGIYKKLKCLLKDSPRRLPKN